MMRDLVLMRHAEAAPARTGMRDLDRELTAGGEAAAARAGEHLRANGFRPSAVVASPSRRTQRTAALVLQAGGWAVPVQVEHRLYEASMDDLRAVIGSRPEPAVLLVGHNPGLSDLTLSLADVPSLPPAGLVRLKLDAKRVHASKAWWP